MEWTLRESLSLLEGSGVEPSVAGMPLAARLHLSQAPAGFAKPISHRKTFKPPFVVRPGGAVQQPPLVSRQPEGGLHQAWPGTVASLACRSMLGV